MEVEALPMAAGGAAAAQGSATGHAPPALAPEPVRHDVQGSPHAIGSSVVLHGLTSRKDLVGQRAAVLSWYAETMRLGVKLDTSGEAVLVRPGHVRPSIFSSPTAVVVDPR